MKLTTYESRLHRLTGMLEGCADALLSIKEGRTPDTAEFHLRRAERTLRQTIAALKRAEPHPPVKKPFLGPLDDDRFTIFEANTDNPETWHQLDELMNNEACAKCGGFNATNHRTGKPIAKCTC